MCSPVELTEKGEEGGGEQESNIRCLDRQTR